jgi:hypothetical protein
MSPKQLVKVALRDGSRYYSRKQANDEHSRERKKSCSKQKVTGLRAKNLCQTKVAN